ncbi:MAG: inositol monophosphatase family protein [Gammaproteobacteria bacterium]
MYPILNIAINAATRASEIINRNIDQIDTLTITEKQVNDFVCEVDIQAERVIIDTIRKSYPWHCIITEESGQLGGYDEFTWIVDPLDGTANYLHGFPHYSISIAIKHKDKLEHGIVYDPVRKELFTASRGQGAQLNERRIRVGTQQRLDKALLGTGFPFRDKQLSKRYLQTFEAFFAKCSGIRRAGSAALDLAYVAAGRLDGFWEFSSKIWDVAAGALLVKEAGGLVSDFSGNEEHFTSGNIVAANPRIFKGLLQVLQPTLGTEDLGRGTDSEDSGQKQEQS